MRTLARASVMALFASLALGGCSSDDSGGDEVFLSVDASAATYDGTTESGTLMLTGMDHGVVFIALSPDAEAWTGDPADVPAFFEGLTLNAVVVSPRTGDAVALALSAPVFDDATGALAFSATGLDDLGDAQVVSAPDESLIPPSPGDWGPVTVFVDPTDYKQRRTPGVYVASPATCSIAIDNYLHPGSLVTVFELEPDDGTWVGPGRGSASDASTFYWQYPGCADTTATLHLTISTSPAFGGLAFEIGPDGVQQVEDEQFPLTSDVPVQINGNVVTLGEPQ